MEDISIYDITIWLGILGLLLITFSFLSGMRIIKTNPKLRLHKKLSIIGFIFAAIHGLVMLYFYLFG